MGQESYETLPKLPVLEEGILLQNKKVLHGTNAAGINEADENYEYGGEEVVVEPGSTLMFVGDKQFMAANKETSMSAWVRCHLIADEKIIWITLLCEPKRIWDFETFRGKKRKIQEAIEGTFDFL